MRKRLMLHARITDEANEFTTRLMFRHLDSIPLYFTEELSTMK